MTDGLNVTVRIADFSDAHSIASIHVLSWQTAYRNIIPAAVLDALSISDREKDWKNYLSNNVKVLILERDGVGIGFCSVCSSRDKDTGDKCGEISAIYLHPNEWGKGFGKQLMNAGLAELKKSGFNEVIVWFIEKNDQANQFYEKMGFVNTGDSELVDFSSVSLKEIRYKKKPI